MILRSAYAGGVLLRSHNAEHSTSYYGYTLARLVPPEDPLCSPRFVPDDVIQLGLHFDPNPLGIR